MRAILLLLTLFVFTFAKENFSEMSTQELIAIMGFVDKKDENRFNKELEKRISSMSEKQKAQYESKKK